MKEYKVKINVKPTKDGREVRVKVSTAPFPESEVTYFRACPAGEVRQAILDLISIAFDDALEV